MLHARRFAAAMVLMMLTLTGCTASSLPGPDDLQTHTGEVQVSMARMRFEPAAIKVKAGSTIRFVNRDGLPHDVVQIEVSRLGKEAAGFTSPVIRPGDVWSVTLKEPGRYPIICTQAAHYASGMTGVIYVVK